MFKLFNAILVCTVLVSAFVLYSLEHSTRALERSVAKTEKQIIDEHERIRLLNAEWAGLTKPDRLQKIAEEQLHLQTLKAQQFISPTEIAPKVPQTPPVKLEAQSSDVIGDMLEKLQ